ncbi:MAG: PD-(D/E)XK nuclease family protein, partial [Planctomycetota bacterium]
VLHWTDERVLPFLGYADAITREEDGDGVVDLKTSTSKKTALDLKLDTALTGYALANELATGYETRQVAYAVIERKKDPTTAYVAGVRANNDFHRLFKICATLTHALHEGIFLPVDGSMDCGYCAFGEHCDRLFGQPYAA